VKFIVSLEFFSIGERMSQIAIDLGRLIKLFHDSIHFRLNDIFSSHIERSQRRSFGFKFWSTRP
jgi:hypothetical protein